MAKKQMTKRKKKMLRAVVVLVAVLLIAAVAGGSFLLSRWLKKLPYGQDAAVLTADGTDAVAAALAQNVALPRLPLSGETADGFYCVRQTEAGVLYMKSESRDGVTYLTINGHEMILVNKEFTVPDGYGDGTTAEAQRAYNDMMDAAAAAGHSLGLVSGFRSYAEQEQIHNNYLSSGRWTTEYVKEMSAEPGHSEHQLGLAFDVSDDGTLYKAFGQTEAGLWLAEHAAEYGFILRYPDGKTWATGYMYEPWHFRYVGVELAQLISATGLTVEELIGRPAGIPPIA